MSFMIVQVRRLFMSRLDLCVSAEGSNRQNIADHCLKVETRLSISECSSLVAAFMEVWHV